MYFAYFWYALRVQLFNQLNDFCAPRVRIERVHDFARKKRVQFLNDSLLPHRHANSGIDQYRQCLGNLKYGSTEGRKSEESFNFFTFLLKLCSVYISCLLFNILMEAFVMKILRNYPFLILPGV